MEFCRRHFSEKISKSPSHPRHRSSLSKQVVSSLMLGNPPKLDEHPAKRRSKKKTGAIAKQWSLQHQNRLGPRELRKLNLDLVDGLEKWFSRETLHRLELCSTMFNVWSTPIHYHCASRNQLLGTSGVGWLPACCSKALSAYALAVCKCNPISSRKHVPEKFATETLVKVHMMMGLPFAVWPNPLARWNSVGCIMLVEKSSPQENTLESLVLMFHLNKQLYTCGSLASCSAKFSNKIMWLSLSKAI